MERDLWRHNCWTHALAVRVSLRIRKGAPIDRLIMETARGLHRLDREFFQVLHHVGELLHLFHEGSRAHKHVGLQGRLVHRHRRLFFLSLVGVLAV